MSWARQAVLSANHRGHQNRPLALEFRQGARRKCEMGVQVSITSGTITATGSSMGSGSGVEAQAAKDRAITDASVRDVKRVMRSPAIL